MKIYDASPRKWKQISAWLICGVLLVGCNDKALFEEVEVEVESGEVKTRELEIRDVIVTVDSDTLPVNSTVTFEVFAETEVLFEFDDGPQEIAAHGRLSRVNISALAELTLESSEPEILFIAEQSRIGMARKAGTVTVYAHFKGVQSAPLTLEILPALTSCGEVNNTDKNNASGACLKIVKGTSGKAKDKLFTANPSMNFLDTLNYVREDSHTNTGKSYAGGIVGIGTYATRNTHFGLFRQDGRDATVDGTNGQYDRYCQNLARLNFLERNDWRRATGQELSQLFKDLGSLFDNYGFFNKGVYWSSSQTMPGFRPAKSFEFFRVGLYKGNIYMTDRAQGLAASCVSQQANKLLD
ncbi:hypothetical protein [Vibrio celticus]|uniref:hypothetical protein n=1 Tax=Vibrio celticus TaxID=446372 RepID=UPI0040676159